jgi:transposase
MSRPYEDDLRCKVLEAHDRGAGTLPELAQVFGVSLPWVWKISAARKRTGQSERVPHAPGRKRKVDEAAELEVLIWFEEQPDLTIDEVRARLADRLQIPVARSAVGRLLNRLKLHRKKRLPRSGTGDGDQPKAAHRAS